MIFSVATWNVNSLKVRLPQVLEWLQAYPVDVLAIQETKLMDENFPIEAIQAAGYQAVFSGQKTYNGVAILSRSIATDIVTEMPQRLDPQKRILAATIQGIRIINLYVPNGESVGSEKYSYKLEWLQAMQQFLAMELKNHSKLIVLGDFNIAPENQDVHDPSAWEGKVLFSEKERESLKQWMALGLQDCFRLHPQPEKMFSWWDYRMNGFKRNLGLRIDHILASAEMSKICTKCMIDKLPRAAERPSDHAPVIADFDFMSKTSK